MSSVFSGKIHMNFIADDENTTSYINVILNVSSVLSAISLISYESSDNSFHDHDISFKFMALFFYLMNLLHCLLFHWMKAVSIVQTQKRNIFFILSTTFILCLGITCTFVSICLNLYYLESDKLIESRTPIIVGTISGFIIFFYVCCLYFCLDMKIL